MRPAIDRRQLVTSAVWIGLCVLTACAGPVVKTIGENDITGRIVDRQTTLPISGACVSVAIDKGGFWTSPSIYPMGSACTDATGSFRIPADPHRVWNVADPRSRPYLRITAPGYANAVYIPNRIADPLQITLVPK